jgi:hypothetical protein
MNKKIKTDNKVKLAQNQERMPFTSIHLSLSFSFKALQGEVQEFVLKPRRPNNLRLRVDTAKQFWPEWQKDRLCLGKRRFFVGRLLI